MGPPLFLTGTENKIRSYTQGIFYHMYRIFLEMLSENRLIIMSGYGWHDTGINTRILDWLSTGENRILLLHEMPETICNGNAQMTYQYGRLRDAGKIVEIEKWLCDTTVDDIMAALSKC